jgi:hypothetical protein
MPSAGKPAGRRFTIYETAPMIRKKRLLSKFLCRKNHGVFSEREKAPEWPGFIRRKGLHKVFYQIQKRTAE